MCSDLFYHHLWQELFRKLRYKYKITSVIFKHPVTLYMCICALTFDVLFLWRFCDIITWNIHGHNCNVMWMCEHKSNIKLYTHITCIKYIICVILYKC